MNTTNLKYCFFVYRNDNGYIQQITLTDLPILPTIPEEDGVCAESMAFYNPELCGCYYKDGTFYEDEEKTKAISEPANYRKPEPEPEPVEEKYTLDEAVEIIINEVSEVND